MVLGIHKKRSNGTCLYISLCRVNITSRASTHRVCIYVDHHFQSLSGYVQSQLQSFHLLYFYMATWPLTAAAAASPSHESTKDEQRKKNINVPKKKQWVEKKIHTQKRTTKIKTKCRERARKKHARETNDGKKTFTFLVASINKRTNCWCARYFRFLFRQSTLNHGKWPELMLLRSVFVALSLSLALIPSSPGVFFCYLPYHHIKLQPEKSVLGVKRKRFRCGHFYIFAPFYVQLIFAGENECFSVCHFTTIQPFFSVVPFNKQSAVRIHQTVFVWSIFLLKPSNEWWTLLRETDL